jgi:hypothetical protein
MPHLILSKGRRGRYVTLSHCWGGKEHLMTKSSNITQLLSSIDMMAVSKTVRNAIEITRKLGIQYLWVDSLCIVQDDKHDWLSEAPRMGSIYEKAYVTLAASTAANGSMGLLAPYQSDEIVRMPCKPGDSATGYMYFAPEDIHFKEVKESPLNSRGWVMQERLLSRRTIHFAATQMYWECRTRYEA